MDEQESGAESSEEKTNNNSSQKPNESDKAEDIPTSSSRDALEGADGDALAWLEGPAFDSPIEEMPTLQWPDVEAEAASAGVEPNEIGTPGSVGETPSSESDDLEGAMQWLEDLAREQGTPIDEMPTLVSGGESQPESAEEIIAAMGLNEIGDTTPPPQIDSDPMAWLEQLAIDQDSPLEELPSVADRLLASEIASQTPLDSGQGVEPTAVQSVDLEDALRFLEEEAVAQGVSLDEVSFDDVEPQASLQEDLDNLDKLVAVAAAAKVVEQIADDKIEDEIDDISSQTPEDSDDTLSWLGDIAEEGTPEQTDLHAEEELLNPDVLDGMPEDPDEAMAWMGELAEDDSIPMGTPVEQDIVSETEEIESSEKDGSVLKKASAAVGALFAAQSLAEGDEESEKSSDNESLNTDILDGMPEDPDEAMAWMAGLAAAEQITHDAKDEPDQPEKIEEAVPDKNQETNLDKARAAISEGDVETATKQFRSALDESEGGQPLIDELESAVSDNPEEPELLQLLGDAYMQNGQLQKALKTYNRGFDR